MDFFSHTKYNSIEMVNSVATIGARGGYFAGSGSRRVVQSGDVRVQAKRNQGANGPMERKEIVLRCCINHEVILARIILCVKEDSISWQHARI